MNPLDILKLLSQAQPAQAEEVAAPQPQGLDLIKIAIQRAEAKRAAEAEEAPVMDQKIQRIEAEEDEDPDRRYRERE